MSNKFIKELSTYRWRLKNGSEDCEYISKWSDLINNKKFKRAVKNAGYELAFMAHPLMQDYTDLFDIPDDVKILSYNSSWKDLFAYTALMITDYSSVAFDIAFLEKPVIYYQFDSEEFFANHSYQRGYFDYKKMGFGPVINSEDELVKEVRRSVRKKATENIYIERSNAFFRYRDNNNSRRVLDAVIERGFLDEKEK